MRINYKTKQLLDSSTETEKEVQFAVEDTSLQLQSDVLATKRDLESAKILLEKYKTEYPLNVEQVIEQQLTVESLEDGLKRLQKLQTELGLI